MKDGGRLINEDLEKVLYEQYLRDLPFEVPRGPWPTLSRRRRFGIRVSRLRWRIADLIGGGRYYTEGCDHDIDY